MKQPRTIEDKLWRLLRKHFNIQPSLTDFMKYSTFHKEIMTWRNYEPKLKERKP